MHTVELLEEALAAVKQLGYDVRLEWLETGGGVCEFGGRRWLFVDLAQTAAEQLAQVRDVLVHERASERLALPQPLLRQLLPRRAA